MLARRVHASTFNGNVKLWVWVSPIPKVSRCGLACGTFTQVIWTCVKVCERPYRPFPLEGVWFRLWMPEPLMIYQLIGRGGVDANDSNRKAVQMARRRVERDGVKGILFVVDVAFANSHIMKRHFIPIPKQAFTEEFVNGVLSGRTVRQRKTTLVSALGVRTAAEMEGLAERAAEVGGRQVRGPSARFRRVVTHEYVDVSDIIKRRKLIEAGEWPEDSDDETEQALMPEGLPDRPQGRCTHCVTKRRGKQGSRKGMMTTGYCPKCGEDDPARGWYHPNCWRYSICKVEAHQLVSTSRQQLMHVSDRGVDQASPGPT